MEGGGGTPFEYSGDMDNTFIFTAQKDTSVMETLALYKHLHRQQQPAPEQLAKAVMSLHFYCTFLQ